MDDPTSPRVVRTRHKALLVFNGMKTMVRTHFVAEGQGNNTPVFSGFQALLRACRLAVPPPMVTKPPTAGPAKPPRAKPAGRACGIGAGLFPVEATPSYEYSPLLSVRFLKRTGCIVFLGFDAWALCFAFAPMCLDCVSFFFNFFVHPCAIFRPPDKVNARLQTLNCDHAQGKTSTPI